MFVYIKGSTRTDGNGISSFYFPERFITGHVSVQSIRRRFDMIGPCGIFGIVWQRGKSDVEYIVTIGDILLLFQGRIVHVWKGAYKIEGKGAYNGGSDE